MLYACALLVGALLVLGAAVVLDGQWPAAGPVLLLAIPMALCMNRFVFFPNEMGITADAAVIFAAMVGFHDGAPWLGPMLVALLAGPLDSEHWSARAFVRMAYNSGSTALATAVALFAFDLGTGALGSSAAALLGAVAVASVPYVFAQWVFGVVLEGLLGERLVAAVRHQIPISAIEVPLALLGPLAGLAAIDVGWWSASLLLLPAPLLPELVLVRVRRGVQRPPVRVVGGLLALGAVLVALTVLLPGSSAWGRTVGVLAVACFVGAECRVTVWPLPPPAGLVVLPAAVLIVPGTPAVVVAAALAGTGFLLLASSPRATVWSLPLLACAASAAGVWATIGRVGALGFCAGVGAAVAIAGAWGPVPWTSRVLVPRLSRRILAHRRTALLVGALGAVGASWCAIRAGGDARTGWALAGVALLEAVEAMAALAVRLWRFAPRRRTVDVLVLTTSALLSATAYLGLALEGATLSVPLAAVLAAAVSFVAWPLAPDRAPAASDVSEELDVSRRQ